MRLLLGEGFRVSNQFSIQPSLKKVHFKTQMDEAQNKTRLVQREMV